MARQFNATYYYSSKHPNFNVPTKAEYDLHNLLNNQNRKFTDVILTMPPNDVVLGNVSKCWMHINSGSYKKGEIYVSISGGSDSDVVLDMTRRCDPQRKCRYFFVDTGLESKFTHTWLDLLQLKYECKIERVRAKVSIPAAIKKYGQPFVSKRASEYIHRLQEHGFQWENEDLITLLDRYCQKSDIPLSKKWVKVGDNYYYGCVMAIKWWCNAHSEEGEKSRFNIDYNSYLKEFILSEGGVPFKVASTCCTVVKKATLHRIFDTCMDKRFSNCRLNIQGVRRSEGGQRASTYKSCFNDASGHDYDEYRPVFWFLNKDKEEYCNYCGVGHSHLYDFLRRTGCSGCCFGQDVEFELKVFKENEPNMAKAMEYVFGDSYEFTRKYHAFQKKMRLKKKSERELEKLSLCEYRQMTIFDYVV